MIFIKFIDIFLSKRTNAIVYIITILFSIIRGGLKIINFTNVFVFVNWLKMEYIPEYLILHRFYI